MHWGKIAASGPTKLCKPQYVEPVPVPDVFITGIAKVEITGHNARFYLYVDQNSFDPGREPDKFIVAKIIIPLENLPEAIKIATEASVTPLVDAAVSTLKRLVKMN